MSQGRDDLDVVKVVEAQPSLLVQPGLTFDGDEVSRASTHASLLRPGCARVAQECRPLPREPEPTRP